LLRPSRESREHGAGYGRGTKLGRIGGVLPGPRVVIGGVVGVRAQDVEEVERQTRVARSLCAKLAVEQGVVGQVDSEPSSMRFRGRNSAAGPAALRHAGSVTVVPRAGVAMRLGSENVGLDRPDTPGVGIRLSSPRRVAAAVDLPIRRDRRFSANDEPRTPGRSRYPVKNPPICR
jgi:hypothetical protein